MQLNMIGQLSLELIFHGLKIANEVVTGENVQMGTLHGMKKELVR